eukprot:84124-Chlamydomonas_euryale.AAC.1
MLLKRHNNAHCVSVARLAADTAAADQLRRVIPASTCGVAAARNSRRLGRAEHIRGAAAPAAPAPARAPHPLTTNAA